MKNNFQPLINVAIVIMGQSPSSETYNQRGDGLPFFQGKAEFGDIHPVATKWCSSPIKIANKDDILISVRAPVGPTNIADERCCIGRGLAAVRPINEKSDRDYIWYFLRFIEAELIEKGQGSTFESINADDLTSLEIPICSLTEQRCIAARLKTQLAEVEKARKAVNIQLHETKTLLKAYLQEAFEGEEAKKWPVVPLGETGEIVSGITLGRKETNKELREVPYLRVANVKDGYLDLTEIKTVAATESEISKWRLQSGDILLTEGGDPDKLGRGTFWSDELEECIHQNHIFRVRFPSDKYLHDFLAAQFGSSYGKAYFLAHAKKTTGIASINQKVLKNFPLLSPTIEKQRELMNRLSEKVQQSQNVVSAIRIMAKEIDILPSCLLSKAFELKP